MRRVVHHRFNELALRLGNCLCADDEWVACKAERLEWLIACAIFPKMKSRLIKWQDGYLSLTVLGAVVSC